MTPSSSFTRRRFLGSLAAAAASSQSSISLSASLVRPVLASADAASSSRRLDSGWEFYRGALDGPWEVWHGDDIAVWERVKLPHCFNHYDACDPDVPYYRGHGWYRTRIPAAHPPGDDRTLLYFEGAGQLSRVYIGQTLVGAHDGGYDEFVVDITDAARAASPESGKDGVPLAVLCDNSENLELPPSDLSDFSLYGGIYRHVHLASVAAVSLEAVHIAPSLGDRGEAEVAITGRLYNPRNHPGEGTIAVAVVDPEGREVLRSERRAALWSGEREISRSAIPSPALWSPDHPSLYTCTVTLTTPFGRSVVRERFGIRHAEFVPHGPFLLNGERLLLNGTQRHMDHAGFAAAQPDELIRKEMELARAMGANFIRLGHYQQTRLVLDLCDELGLLAWEEAPWCRSGVGDEGWKSRTRAMLANMIDQHFNHPSILMWGLGNEDDWPGEYPALDQAAIRGFVREMNDLAHTLDPSRFTSLRRCDFARDIPDVYSPSIWAGWYSGVYTDYEHALNDERQRVRRMLHVEWGADSHAGRHAEAPYEGLTRVPGAADPAERNLDYLPTGGPPRVSRDGDWSETYACDLFDWHLQVQERLPWLAGSAMWVLKDFTTPLRTDNPVPRINQKGVLERDLTKKEGYFVFQSYWSREPMAHIYGHGWPVRWGREGETRVVKVYSNCPGAELFLNGRSMGARIRNSRDFPAAGLCWSVQFAPGRNHLRVTAARDGVAVTDEIEFEYQTEGWGAAARLELAEVERDASTSTIEARLRDRNGALCLDARNQVRFTLAGSGRLIDNLGTSRGSRVVQLYNGRARISVDRNGGVSTAGVTSEGIAPAFVTLSA